MNKTYLRGPGDIHLHQRIVQHLQNGPAKYTQLWEFYGSQGALFILLQRMLDAGEIAADNLKNGLITDNSTIALGGGSLLTLTQRSLHGTHPRFIHFLPDLLGR